MEKTKILFVSQEITPYLPESSMSVRGRYLPQGIQEKGREIRVFMPRYGIVNERRNQLHEVIRLSGMNLIIDDTDHPLIIKVASIQAARMQVYFIDNEDYFQRKFTLKDENGEYFEDNDERTIFYARGVMETVKKLRWSPSVIHCQGWFSALVAVYAKKMYSDDPLFTDSKIIYAIHDDDFSKSFPKDFASKIINEDISLDDLSSLSDPTYLGLNKLAIDYADGIIWGTPEKNSELEAYVKESGKPTLEFQSDDEYIVAFSNFYDSLISEKTEE